MDQVPPETVERGVVGGGPGPHDHVQVGALPVRPGQPASPHDLAQAALQPVALGDGTPVPGHHEGHPGPGGRGGADEDLEVTRLVAGPFPEDRPDLSGASDARPGGEALPSGRPAPPGAGLVRQRLRRFRWRSWPTASRFRPFRRRRARMRRPDFVFIRARNPCRRRRFLSLALCLSAPISSTVGRGIVGVRLPGSSP